MTQVTTLDLAAVRTTAEDIARQAAAVIMDFYHKGFKQQAKSTQIDIVTEADSASELVIVAALRAAFPEHHIVGEEGGGQGAAIEGAAYRWYVDPIDGTTNFANHLPIFAVSLALTDADMRPLVGVVYNPAMDEMFSAARGLGATRNGMPIHVSETRQLQQCVLASGFPYDKHTDPENNLAQWGRFLLKVRGLRRLGAAALDCCYVATGRFDGYWEAKVKPWDVLAGMLCVEEAGGRLTDYQGQTPANWILNGRVVVSNGHIHQQMIDTLAEAASGQ